MNRVMHPPAALLHTDTTPLYFGQKPATRERLRELLGEDDVPASAKKFSRLAAAERRAAAHLYSCVSSRYFSEYSMREAMSCVGMCSREARAKAQQGRRGQAQG